MNGASPSPHPGLIMLGIETDPSDPSLCFEKLNQISSLMTLPNTSAVAGLCEPLNRLLGLWLMNDWGRLAQQRPSVKPEAPEELRGGGGSLINIDLAPKEAAHWRAGSGHPRRGPIKLGSTAQPGG